MNPIDFSIKIEGIYPLLQNRNWSILNENPEFEKQRGEDWLPYENRIWINKAYINDKNEVYAPGVWFKQAIIDSQRASKHAIQPADSRRKNETMKVYFIGGILYDDQLAIRDKNGSVITKDMLKKYTTVCKIPSTGGAIPCVRPCIDIGWVIDVKGVIIDEAINVDMIIDCFKWIGAYSGIGDYRPQNGGPFGRFLLA